MATPIKFTAEVARIIRHGPDVATYEFHGLSKQPRFKPGQFLHLTIDLYDPSQHWPESRVFTIANGPSRPGFLRLTIAAKGRYTRRIIDQLEVGRKVWMKAPYGHFVVHTAQEQEAVLIAGGTGVTPFVAFMEDALVRGMQGDVWLHYGARRGDLLVFAELARRCAAKFANFHARLCAEEGAGGEVLPGMLSLEEACAPLRSVARAVFYLCGPQTMVKSFASRLGNEFGVRPDNIRFDKWE